MNKKILLISIVLLTLILITIVIFNNIDNEESNIISNIKDKQVINNNMITMMYETEAGSGEYTETSDNTWPESGYIFNENLSGCENGGELEYNSINKTVNLLSNKSDRCYVYFDKYDGVWIDNVSVTNVTGSSVTLDISATSENGNITTYYYSLNDSEEYQETTSSPITINDLNKLTEYKISIYAIDSTNARSNIYELDVSTTDISVPVINSVEVSDITDSGFTLTVNATSDIGISKYYFIIDSNNVAGVSSENNYIFKNLNVGTEYSVTIYVKDLNGHLSDGYIFNIKTNELSLASYIKHLFTSQGENSLYYHDASLENGANDGSYRFSGANPNNYVCFGSDDATCPSDNLYRIIGVFGSEVKLIKSDYTITTLLGTNGNYDSNSYDNYGWDTGFYKGNLNTSSIGLYYWSYPRGNDWSKTQLNTMNLNTNYLNSFTSTWQQKIATHIWKVGGGSNLNLIESNAQTAYNYEVGNNSNNTTYTAKIGLMYVSDYYYGATNNYWSYPGSSDNSTNDDYRTAINYNWMHMGLYELTITPSLDNSDWACSIQYFGGVNCYYAYDVGMSVRPVFYLNFDVTYVSGTGTQSDPFRIA